MRLETRRPGGAPRVLEVTFDHSLATVAKSELLARCTAASPEAMRLARLLRHWADERGIAGQRHGYLSGYAWCLLAVFFLQCRGQLAALVPRLGGLCLAFLAL